MPPPHPCPICQVAVDAQAPAFPFCSMRCKSVDLGNWLDGTYTDDDDEDDESLA